jgi:hypothetical protein
MVYQPGSMTAPGGDAAVQHGSSWELRRKMSGLRLRFASRSAALFFFVTSARKGRNSSLNNLDRFNFARLESIPEDRQTRK